ncbi:MAG: hypothetical protein RLZZ08_1616 [Pseudomonadota bacterium]|jgi:nucleoid-associated protein YejK
MHGKERGPYSSLPRLQGVSLANRALRAGQIDMARYRLLRTVYISIQLVSIRTTLAVAEKLTCIGYMFN